MSNRLGLKKKKVGGDTSLRISIVCEASMLLISKSGPYWKNLHQNLDVENWLDKALGRTIVTHSIYVLRSSIGNKITTIISDRENEDLEERRKRQTEPRSVLLAFLVYRASRGMSVGVGNED